MPETALVTIIPLGTVDLAEVEAAAKRVAKNLGLGVEVIKPVPMPVGHFDAPRGQSDARKVIAAVPATVLPPPRPAPGTTADPTATRAAALSPAESWGSRVHGGGAPPARRAGPPKPPPPPHKEAPGTDTFPGRK